MTVRSLEYQLENVEWIRITIETIRQRLRKDNLQLRVPARKLWIIAEPDYILLESTSIGYKWIKNELVLFADE